MVVSAEEMHKRIFKFILLGSLSLGVNKIYACEGEMNDIKKKVPPLELPLFFLLISHEPVWNSLCVLPQYGPSFFCLNPLCFFYFIGSFHMLFLCLNILTHSLPIHLINYFSLFSLSLNITYLLNPAMTSPHPHLFYLKNM